MEDAEAERQAGGLGHPGRPLNARSPFMIGMKGAAGVAVTYGLVELFLQARGVLVLIGLAFFIAAGLDPVVVWLTRHGLRRWAAVIIVVLALLAFVGGFIAAAIPPVTAQISTLINELPHYVHELQDHSSTLGKLNDKYHIETRITSLLNSKGAALVGGVIGAGQIAISTLSSMLLVAVMTIYFLVGMPADQAVPLPPGPALAAPAGDPHRRRDLHQGRRLRPRQRDHLVHRRRRDVPVDAGVGHPVPGTARPARSSCST